LNMRMSDKKSVLRWLGIATMMGVVFGLVFGYLNKNYARSLVISFSIAYTIFLLNCIVERLYLNRMKNASREKRLLVEIPTFFITAALGFFVCMSVYSRVYGIPVFTGRFLWTQLGILLIIYVILSSLIYSYKFYRELGEKEATEEKLKRLSKEIELKGLKSQMNPHFLFNTLNSINALVTEDPKQAREMVVMLSDLLRISLENRDRLLMRLKEELDFVHIYLEIERMRFRDRLDFVEEIDASLMGMYFPAMVLQPLLENAVKHGISKRRGRGWIHLSINTADDRVECLVSNSVSEHGPVQKLDSRNGTGLKNIRQRLDLLYSDAYHFQTGYTDSGDFEVQLIIPMESHGKD